MLSSSTKTETQIHIITLLHITYHYASTYCRWWEYQHNILLEILPRCSSVSFCCVCVCVCWSVSLRVSAASWVAVVGIGLETAGVMTFSQRATEQHVIFFHGRWAHRFRKAQAGIPIQINTLDRGRLAGTLKMRWRERRDYQCLIKLSISISKCLRLMFNALLRKSFISLHLISLTLPGASGLKHFILHFTCPLNKQAHFQ